MVTESRLENLGEGRIKDSHAISIQTLMDACSCMIFFLIRRSQDPPAPPFQNKNFNSGIQCLTWQQDYYHGIQQR